MSRPRTTRTGLARRGALIATAAAATMAVLAAGAPAEASTLALPPVPLAGQCSMVNIAVALAPGDPADQTLAAEYCTPMLAASTVDVLLAGATYTLA
jgi:hypothetical protein